MNATPLPAATMSLDDKRELLKSLISLQSTDPAEGLPLSYGQQSLWFVYRLAPDSPAYNFLFAAHCDGELDRPALARACQALARRHAALRTRFHAPENRPVQRADVEPQFAVPEIDATEWDQSRLDAELRRRADVPFDLGRGPALCIELYRRPGARFVLLLVFHHIIVDLWSMDVLLQDLSALYAAERRGQAATLPPVRAQFSDYVRWQLANVHGERGREALAHWQRVLGGDLPVLELPTDRPRPAAQTYRGAAHSWRLADEAVSQLRELARRESATPFVSMLSAFALLLHRASGQDEVVIGTATADRVRPEWERVVGYFVNQVAVRSIPGRAETFTDLVRQTRNQVHEALEYQDYPFGLLVRRLQPRRDPSRSPIFQVMFIWDKPGLTARDPADGLRLEPFAMEQRGAPFDLTLIIFEQPDGLTASLRYNSDLFDAATVERLARQFDGLLRTTVAAPECPLADVPTLTPAEQKQILGDWNATCGPFPNDRAFHRLVEAQAERSPDAVAVEYDGRRLTYAALNARANRLARRLGHMGVGRGDVVGISLPRGTDVVIAVLAVWKAGAAYLPLDPAYPARRLAAMVEDAKPVALIAAEFSADRPVPTVRLPEDWPALDALDGSDLEVEVGPDDRAYVIFTSGSTGRPKGVPIAHRGLCNLSEATLREFSLDASDRVLQFASLNFDASVFEMAMALRAGAALVLVPQAATLSGPALHQLLRDAAVTVATLSPSVLAAVPTTPLPDLDTIVVAGEACPAELVAAWAPGRRFFNAYGPTETTVWATLARCRPDGRPPRIGRPILNARCYVLDANLQPVGVAVNGELYVAGPGLAAGYLGQPALTAERFLPDPFGAPGARMYRTGDHARWDPAGELEFLGRVDDQVKIRGHRIEPGEVSEVLRQHPAVADAAVVVAAGGQNGPTLAAYVVPRDPRDFPLAELRTHLRDRLPHYMLPASVTALAALPLTPSGKVDRAALPAPQASSGPATTTPQTPTEKVIAAVWSKVLNVPSVGAQDNFFELGGASIQTIEVVEAAGRVGLTLTPEMIFRHQTVAELAAACDSNPADGTAARTEDAPNRTDEFAAAAQDRRHAAAAALARPDFAAKAMTRGTVVESLGAYLPDRVVSTEALLHGCRAPIDFPLERMSGIRARRMAGDGEFAIDLATHAVGECLSRSSRRPEEIDLLICCNISRFDGPNRMTMEPTTAARLRQRFGLLHALAFDVNNACAGTFTAITLADALLRRGAANRALVVSGEYITHLSATAQREIQNFMDPRMACLTLGDSGVAILLGPSPEEGVGFREIDLYTLGKYHDLCVAKVTPEPHGGAIMYTDAVKSSAVTIRQAVNHAVEVLRRRGWSAEAIDRLIMHQTSQTTLDGAVREINQLVGQPVCHRGNTAYNVADWGNVATNSHFLAFWEDSRAGRIKSGDRVVFGVSGSGQTVGTALYVCDDLPERLRDDVRPVKPAPNGAAAPRPPRLFRCQKRVRIESAAVAEPGGSPADTVALLRAAGEDCLRRSSRPREEIDLVVHTGVYRNEFLSEPALAAIAAGELRINHDDEAPAPRRTFAFDLMNGAAGTLTGCLVAGQLIDAGRFTRALVLASEIENNASAWPENTLGLAEGAGALVLEPSAGSEGFAAFAVRWFPEHLNAIEAHTTAHAGTTALAHRRNPSLDEQVVGCVRVAVVEFLRQNNLDPNDVSLLVPPQRSRAMGEAVAIAVGVPIDRAVLPAADSTGDPYTTSLARTFVALRDTGRLRPGDLALVVDVAAGLQVACALYYG